MRLFHNMNSLNLYNKYSKNLKVTSSSINKISSGIKIGSAKDNPNKIGQSESMKIKIKSMQVAQRNMQDGSAMLQAADGALEQINNMLIRIKELSVSAADGSKTEDDNKTIQDEVSQLLKSINDISSNTEFNGVKLIGQKSVSDNKMPEFQVATTGAEVGDNMKIPLYNVNVNNLIDADGNKLADIDMSTKDGATQSMKVIDAAIRTISSIRSEYGAISNKFESSYDRLQSSTDVTQDASSKLTDTDIAEEMINLSKSQILYQTQIALIAQSNEFPRDALKVLDKL